MSDRPAPHRDAGNLLTDLFRDALDSGYAASAERRVQSGPEPAWRRRGGLLGRSIALALVGFLLAVAYQQAVAGAAGNSRTRADLATEVAERRAEADRLAREAEGLRDEVTRQRDQALAADPELLRLRDLEARTGLARVTGDGVVVTVSDAPAAVDPVTGRVDRDNLGRVLDRDLQALANALWQCGRRGGRDQRAAADRGVDDPVRRRGDPGGLPARHPAVRAHRHRPRRHRQAACRLGHRQAVRTFRGELPDAVRDQGPSRADPAGGRRPRSALRQPSSVGPAVVGEPQPVGIASMIAVLALAAGVVLGLVLKPTVPAVLEPYLPIAVVAALDAVFGGIRAKLDGIFDDKQFVVSFVANVLVAAFIVFLGDQLGVGGQLSVSVVVVLGVRIFGNVAAIRRHLFRA